jgi:hypothetical protein
MNACAALRSHVRHFCAKSSGAMMDVEEFLRVASRPIMGKAKAKQSAGQRAIDLTKQASKLADLDFPALLRTNSRQLKELGLGVQERKRLLNFVDKYLQGWRHDGRGGKRAWVGWQPPYRQ